MKKHNIPELVAPAGNLEKMKTAFAYGADSVYAGIPAYSLRARVNDFTDARLKTGIAYAHSRGKKFYVTINILAHNRQFKNLPRHIEKLRLYDPDGIILSDPGVLAVVKRIWPGAKLTLSTQANCINLESARFWHQQGIGRIILGREVAIHDIREIHAALPTLALETFVHGAFCMAYSGRCLLSGYLSGRSANLGDCAQPCRWPYRTAGEDGELVLEEDKHGSYILNSRDLCLIEKLPEIIRAGVTAVKIEGRAKSPHYLATVIGAYRRTLDSIESGKDRSGKEKEFLYQELSTKLAHRGYTRGFMFGEGKNAQNTLASHESCKWEFCGQILENKNKKKNKIYKINKNKYEIHVKVHNTLKVGDWVEILMPVYDIIKMRIETMWNSETGEEIKEAHGGQGRVIIMETNREAPEYSVLRRKIVKK